jgi:branched-chain amino acid aminotransferase
MSSDAGDVLLDGQLVPRASARIAVNDLGFLQGDGAFETLRVYRGVPFLLEEHLARLFASLRALQISIPWNRDQLQAQVRLLLERDPAKAKSARLRLTVTRGAEGRPTVLLTVDPHPPVDAEIYQQGVDVMVSAHVRAAHPLHRVKSTSYAASLWLRREAAAAGVFEALQFSANGWLTEGSYTNVFLVDNTGLLRTPSPAEGCLKGITRNAVLTIATESQLAWREGGIDRAALEAAHEVFLTGSLIEIVPVRRVGERAVGEACPGPMARALHVAYRDFVERATGSGPPTADEGN